MVCDIVSAAIRDSLSSSNAKAADRNLQTQLVSTTKRILLTKIEYEDVETLSNSDNLKSKYIVFKPSGSGVTGSSPPKMPGVSAVAGTCSTNGTSSAASVNGSGRESLPAPKRILFSRDSVQIGWRTGGRKWQVGAGLINMGNTCYLNSTLQALFHVPAIANWLMSDENHREKCEDLGGGQGGCIICAMARTLISSQNSQSPIKPWLIHSKLRLVCKHFFPGRQEDAHEFLRYLVEAMEKAYLARFKNSRELDQFSKETTPLNQILGGYLRSTVRCLACGHISTTFQHFEDLLLDIRKANTVEEALGVYFARERLEDMGYKCEACKKKTSATKQFSLERAPVALCIQLKRFSMAGTKLNKHVTIRSRLDLTPYASATRQGGGGALNGHSSNNLVYKLVAMVTHLGASQNCGHYTAIGLTDTGSYYHFDDNSVRPISLQNVLQTNAYIIFYELDESLSKMSHPPVSTATSASGRENSRNGGDYLNGSTNGVSSSQRGDTSPARKFAAGTVSKLETLPGFIGPVLPPDHERTPEKKLTLNGDPHQKITFSITPPNTTAERSPLSISKLVNVTKKMHFNGVPPVPPLPPPRQQQQPKKFTPIVVVNNNSNSNSPKTASEVKSSSDHTMIPPPASKKMKVTAIVPLQGKPRSLVPYESDDESNPSENDEPMIVKTAAGVFEVTSVDESVVKSAALTNGNSSSSIKENGTTEFRNTATVNQLMKMGGHRGYGGNGVHTWNGQRTAIEKEVQEERKEERKRELEHLEENGEMDRGRLKKMKTHHPSGKDNPGYNPFQEYNQRNYTWIQNGRPGHQGHIYRQKSYHHNNYRGYGGGYRGRHRGVFHSNFRPHHGYRRDK